MSYSKKDEDGESAIFKVDRTSVFQEGLYTELLVLSSIGLNLWQLEYSIPLLYRLANAAFSSPR
jgi:hypothetical protein